MSIEDFKLIIRLRGGLGNQMFQIFGGSYYSKKFGIPVILDDADIICHANKSRRSWSRHFNLSTLIGNERVKWNSKIKIFSKKIESRIGKSDPNAAQHITEETLLNLRKISSQYIVRGWFEDKKYFLDHKSYISKESFRPIKGFDKNILLEEIISTKSSAVLHLRLGDFLYSKTGESKVPWNYYLRATEKLLENDIKEIFLFSDDIEVAHRFILENGNLNHVKVNCPEIKQVLNPVELFWILAHAKTFVSSNSTLSWWASAVNPDGRILSPFKDNLKLHHWETI